MHTYVYSFMACDNFCYVMHVTMKVQLPDGIINVVLTPSNVNLLILMSKIGGSFQISIRLKATEWLHAEQLLHKDSGGSNMVTHNNTFNKGGNPVFSVQ